MTSSFFLTTKLERNDGFIQTHINAETVMMNVEITLGSFASVSGMKLFQ